MKLLGFGDIEAFPFLDPPDSRLIKDGYRVLEEIGAVDKTRRVTRIGRQLARLPVDPRVGRMLYTAAHTHCLNEILVIAAALSIQDPRDRPMDKRQEADEAHRQFRNDESDFLGFLNLWRQLEEQRRHLTRRKFQAHCRTNFLSWTRVQEWHDTHHQLRGQMHELGYKENQAEAGYEEIHKALLTGLLSNIGLKESGKGREYLGGRNSRFLVFPGSGLFEKQPKWAMAAELVETTKLYARTVASIRPEWVESVSGHLVKRSYSEPHWEKRRGQVAAYERVSLFGLPLVPKRKINFGPLNPVEAREIFIRSALVEGDFHTRATFWRRNRELIEYVVDLENRSRRRDLLVDDQLIYEYYDKRIPEGIYSTPQFDKWLRQESRSQPKLLHMRLDDLTRQEAAELPDDQYPDALDINGMLLPLEYHFDPGHMRDGVTMKVPQAVLNQVSEERCEWLVPGLLRERVIALLRGLPKPIRKSFVPVPDYANACLEVMEPSDKSLTRVLAEQLKKMTGIHIPEDAWGEGSLSGYLRMNFQVMDEKGKQIDAGRDLILLKKRHGGKGGESYHRLPDSGLEREGLTDWDFATLPKTVEMDRGGIKLRGFPALVDEGDSVALRVLDSQLNAEKAGRAGLRRLYMLKLAKDIRYLRRNLKGLEKMRLQYTKTASPPKGLAVQGKQGLESELVALIVDLTFIEGQPEVRDESSFKARIEKGRGELMTLASEATVLLGNILLQYQQVRKALSGATQINWMLSVSDMKQQLDRLVFQGFLQHTPYQQLKQLPRYLKALEMRLEKLRHAASRDQQLVREMQSFYQQWQARDKKCRESGKIDERVEEMRWQFEELRVSLFAQELRTAYPISLKRIEKRWKELGL